MVNVKKRLAWSEDYCRADCFVKDEQFYFTITIGYYIIRLSIESFNENNFFIFIFSPFFFRTVIFTLSRNYCSSVNWRSTSITNYSESQCSHLSSISDFYLLITAISYSWVYYSPRSINKLENIRSVERKSSKRARIV